VTRAGRQQRPQDVAIVLPDDWWVVPLWPEETRRRSVRRLVDRQFQGVDDQPVLRRDVARKLQSAADEAAAHAGRWMAVSLQRAGGVPVPASLVVSWLDLGPGHGDGHLADLTAELTGQDNRVDVSSATLSCGRVVRRVRSGNPADPDLTAEEVEPVLADYWLEFPSGDGIAQLTFSTPLAVLREPLIELFDAVVATARWTYPEWE
jgi:hypothetical protein